MQKVTSQIDKYSKIHRKSSDIICTVESDAEYQLIVEANNLAVEIDTEIGKKFQQLISDILSDTPFRLFT